LSHFRRFYPQQGMQEHCTLMSATNHHSTTCFLIQPMYLESDKEAQFPPCTEYKHKTSLNKASQASNPPVNQVFPLVDCNNTIIHQFNMLFLRRWKTQGELIYVWAQYQSRTLTVVEGESCSHHGIQASPHLCASLTVVSLLNVIFHGCKPGVYIQNWQHPL
jgi:hypothetical protein